MPLDRGGPYGGETYGVFVFDPRTRRYTEAPALSALTRDYSGMFVADAKQRRLVASSKSGCCINWVSEFLVKELEPVLYSTETVTISMTDGSCTVLTELSKPNAKTRTTRRKCTRDER